MKWRPLDSEVSLSGILAVLAVCLWLQLRAFAVRWPIGLAERLRQLVRKRRRTSVFNAIGLEEHPLFLSSFRQNRQNLEAVAADSATGAGEKRFAEYMKRMRSYRSLSQRSG